MAAFDAAMALHERQLNESLHQIYMMFSPDGPDWAPKIFTGSKDVSQAGIANVSWKIDAPPRFDLSRESMQSAATAIAHENGSRAGNILRENIHELVGTGVPAFVMRFGVWVEVKDERGGREDAYYLPDAEAHCFLQVAGNSVEFVVQNVTCGQTGQFYVESYVLPAVRQALQIVLSGFTILPFSFNGIDVTAPVVSIDEGCIFVAVNMQPKSTPAPARMGGWVSPYFSLVMSRELIQQAVAKQYPTYTDEYHADTLEASYSWNYSQRLVPGLPLIEPYIRVGFSLTGTINTEMYIMGAISLNYTAQVYPNPTANYRLELNYGESVQPDSLQLVSKSDTRFTVIITDSSSISQPSLATLSSQINQQLTLSISRRIWELLRHNHAISLISVPIFPQNLAGKKFRLVPTNLEIVSKDGYIGIAGRLFPKD